MLFRKEPAGVIAAGTGQVRVDVNSTRHHNHAARIESRGTVRQVLYNPTAFDTDVPYFAIDTVGRIVDCSARDSELLRVAHARLRGSPARTAPASAWRTSVADRCAWSGGRS